MARMHSLCLVFAWHTCTSMKCCVPAHNFFKGQRKKMYYFLRMHWTRNELGKKAFRTLDIALSFEKRTTNWQLIRSANSSSHYKMGLVNQNLPLSHTDSEGLDHPVHPSNLISIIFVLWHNYWIVQTFSSSANAMKGKCRCFGWADNVHFTNVWCIGFLDVVRVMQPSTYYLSKFNWQ